MQFKSFLGVLTRAALGALRDGLMPLQEDLEQIINPIKIVDSRY
jgi:hypothetical protein